MSKPLRNSTVRRVFPLALGIMALCHFVGPARGNDIRWTNSSSDGIYTNTENWNPKKLPETTDYTGDVVVLGTQGGTPHTVTRPSYASPSWATTANLSHVRFDTAGWTFASINITNLKTLRSYGAGTNTLDFSWQQQGNQTWIVGPGNTLFLGKSFYCRAATVTVRGGGVLRLSGAFTGFGSGNIYGLKAQDVTVRIESAVPSEFGRVWLDANVAVLQLKTTVAAAQALVGTRIIDNVGAGLKFTDIGDGYVEVSVAPRATLITLR